MRRATSHRMVRSSEGFVEILWIYANANTTIFLPRSYQLCDTHSVGSDAGVTTPILTILSNSLFTHSSIARGTLRGVARLTQGYRRVNFQHHGGPVHNILRSSRGSICPWMPFVEKLDVFFAQGIWNHHSKVFQAHTIVNNQLISYRELGFNVWGYTLEL